MKKDEGNRKIPKILMPTMGSRGDVQPVLALAIELANIGYKPILCAGPNFKDWVESYDIDFVPFGPDLTKTSMIALATHTKPAIGDKEKVRDYSRDVFCSMYQAAKGCDMILAGGSTQQAGASIGEALKIPYICAVYCPAALPSTMHPPLRIIQRFDSQSRARPKSAIKALWKSFEKTQNEKFMHAINEQRASLGLAAITNVYRHVLTPHPWLASETILGPAAATKDLEITQTNSWLLRDNTPLPDTVKAFLQGGEPPIYIGFGSMSAGKLDGQGLIEACRAAKRRAIILTGWANLNVPGNNGDILAVDTINHSKLFPRVAAVVHHGGAGTITTAAIAGVPQIIVPHMYDQYYWGHRVEQLGIGISCRSAHTLSIDALIWALKEVFNKDRAMRALELSRKIDTEGALKTAKMIANRFMNSTPGNFA